MDNKLIKKADDLQTPHKAICDGFLSQALTKSIKANPYIERAIDLKKALSKVKNIKDVIKLKAFKEEIISASGFSEKAKNHLTDKELSSAIEKVFSNSLIKSKNDFRDEILFRYLLTKGDALGGSMRNITGASAGNKLAQTIINKLRRSGKKISIMASESKKIQAILWSDRVILFDVTPKIIEKNIDVILLKGMDGSTSPIELLAKPNNYLACGELKGGIDPAGADEHWKTANSALGRIRAAFKEKCPKLFFIGAAIEAAMAKEIFTQLNDGKLTYAANLTNNDQLDALVNWLISL